MGIRSAPSHCFITGLPTVPIYNNRDVIEYFIELKGDRFPLTFSVRFEANEFVTNNMHILHGLILNGKFPREFEEPKDEILTNEKLEKLIKDSNVPRTPSDKIANLLTYLHSLQTYEGEEISFPDGESKNDLAHRLYFKNYHEMMFYLFTLYHQGLIDGSDVSSNDGQELIDIRLTYNGLDAVLDLADSGLVSDRCFVAMSFSQELNPTRNAIKTAIRKADFNPILIDEIHIDSDVTINDALIAEIRKCRFIVADFSQHKHGVYFEAGFALGLGRQVIYTCHKDEFKKTHFDTNHYPHIIYDNLDELESKLYDKIQAWVA